jgi:hypothetical protein
MVDFAHMRLACRISRAVVKDMLTEQFADRFISERGRLMDEYGVEIESYLTQLVMKELGDASFRITNQA